MVDEAAHQEVRYYSDAKVTVTSKRVKLGKTEYDLADIKWGESKSV